METHDRKPAVAGQFYPSEKTRLLTELQSLFKDAVPFKERRLRALIVPHAGYVFSGKVAASAYNQLDENAVYENIFLIGPSHRASFNGASVYTKGDYITPLGNVKVNTVLTNTLVNNSSVFTYKKEADQTEHDLEVQLPFLQFKLKNQFTIVPVIIGTEDSMTLRKIAAELQPWFTPENLFIISTDFSHYPEYQFAVKTDLMTSEAIQTMDAAKLTETLRTIKKKYIPGLVTSLCGANAVFTLLYLINHNRSFKIEQIDYENSGNSIYGDKTRVVGYVAMALHAKEQINEPAFELTGAEQQQLLAIARKTLESRLINKDFYTPAKSGLSANLLKQCGCFVSLHINGKLRGCIGTFGSKRTLADSVAEMAIAAATEDSRFEPLEADELKNVEIEISVLTPMKRIFSGKEIVLGLDGIYIKKGYRSGTFLPQVATQTNWTTEEFLGHCSRDKAGIGWDGWKSAELYTYRAIVFSE